MALRITAHAHFYQPPRENPWTGKIDVQPDAAPFHDWNERIHAECYRPNAFATVGATGEEDGPSPEPKGRVVNNFERLSFNVGPTLLGWMQAEHPGTYDRIIEADRTSAERLGHGNAIAQAFHHSILPLATTRDIRTEIRWGLADFRIRFGREAEGMWLPETAASDAVLAMLIEEGVGFTILAPQQAGAWREAGGAWATTDSQPIDTRRPYRFVHPHDETRYLSVFFFDAELAREIAFGNLGSSAAKLVDAFIARAADDGHGLVNEATDGETFGHHHKFSELGLAYALFEEMAERDVEVTNYAAYLADNPPTAEMRLVPGTGSSWSCPHGVRRWADDCGCSTYGPEGWDQKWRAPLRAGLEVIKWAVDETYERFTGDVLVDPWGARDRYVYVVSGAASVEDFLEAETAGLADPRARDVAARLLDMQRLSLSMFTSCGWFFYDVSRLETVQILRYAARVLDLLEELGLPLPEDAYLPLLDEAKSNDPEEGTAATILRSLRQEAARS